MTYFTNGIRNEDNSFEFENEDAFDKATAWFDANSVEYITHFCEARDVDISDAEDWELVAMELYAKVTK